MTTIDIHDEIAAICAKLELEPGNVAHIDFRPTSVTATVLRVNEHGSKYLEDGEPACDTLEFKVTT